MSEYFPGYNPENSPESRDTDSDAEKKEKKGEKKRTSFMDELLERRNSKEKVSSDKNDEERGTGLGEIFKKKESADEAGEVAPTRKELAKEFLDHKAEELRDEIENHTSLEQASEAQRDLELVEAISEKIDHPDKEVEPAVEEAYTELMDAMAELDDADDVEEAGEVIEHELENDAEALEDEGTEADDEDSSNPSLAPVASPSPASSSSTGSSSGGTGGSSGSGTTPPPPTPPAGSPPPPPQRRPVTPLPPAGAVPPPPQPNFNTMPTAPSPESTTDYRRCVAGKMIVAGAVGYMIGRRGGRKRTEAKLNPEIKKRDEAIVDLKKDIEAKEDSIRLHARQEAPPKIEPEEAQKPRPERISLSPVEQRAEEAQAEKEPALAPSSNLEREQTVQKTAEKPEADQQRVVHEHQLQLEKEHIKDRVETVSTPVLLQIAEKITVLDTTVRKLYDTNQIDRRGLEEIVKEHLAGHDIGPVLDRRLLGKEAILERSHEYRHDPDSDDAKAKLSSDGPDKELADSTQGPIHDVKPFQPGAFNANMAPSSSEQDEETQPAEIAHQQAQKALNKKYKTAGITAVAVVAIVAALLLVRVFFM